MAWRFNSPPGWPAPPADFVPGPGWQPDPQWPPPPPGWVFWIDDAAVQQQLPGPAQGVAVSGPPAQLSWGERRRQHHDEHVHAKDLRTWQHEQAARDELVHAAQAAAAGQVTAPGLALTRGEVVVWGADAGLIEPRTQPGHYTGHSSGVSVHVAKGMTYRAGATRGHYVPGPEVQTPVDHGRVFITSQRVVFSGSRTTRVWLYSKLVALDASYHDHEVLLHVSNRQKASGVVLGFLGPQFQQHLTIGIAMGSDGVAETVQAYIDEAATHRSQQP